MHEKGRVPHAPAYQKVVSPTGIIYGLYEDSADFVFSHESEPLPIAIRK